MTSNKEPSEVNAYQHFLVVLRSAFGVELSLKVAISSSSTSRCGGGGATAGAVEVDACEVEGMSKERVARGTHKIGT
jgi:hypothetical protein